MSELVIAGGKGTEMFSGARIDKEYFPEDLRTPFGSPSGKVSLLEWEDASFFCFSRHGDRQQLAPEDVPYLANAFALKQLGVKYWVSVSLTSALKGFPEPGCLIVADDYTSVGINRRDQFFGEQGIPGLVLYIDNYTSSVSVALKAALHQAALKSGVALHVNLDADLSAIDDERLIVYAGVNGPETGTLADERIITAPFRNVISGMTNMTEAVVCRQAGMEFAGLSFVGGKGMNYGGVMDSIALYMAGIQEKVVPLLSKFVKIELPDPKERTVDDFLAMCTGEKRLIEAIRCGHAGATEGERRILDVVNVLLR